MSTTSSHHGPTAEAFARWIEMSGESEFIDAKGPMEWDGLDASASLAKDIASFANSRDGGIIVIGKSETGEGTFSYQGVTPAQAASFDTTKVGQWINSRFSPPIRFACYCHERNGNNFVVIVVQEFDDIPTICSKSFQQTNNQKNHLLREGAIYVRNQNAESKLVMNADELRMLIGLATRKRGDELLSHFEAMLQGRSLTDLGPKPDVFEQEVERVKADLGCDLSKGGWWMSFHPQEHRGDLWTSSKELEALISKHSVRTYREYPGSTHGMVSMGWGIAKQFDGWTWALTKTGLFCFWKEFRENRMPAKTTGYVDGNAELPIAAGKWIECSWAIGNLVDFFQFSSRFAGEFKAGEKIHIMVVAGPIAGRILISLDFHNTLGFAPHASRAKEFAFDKVVRTEKLKTAWEPMCAKALNELFELFPDHFLDAEAVNRRIVQSRTRGM